MQQASASVTALVSALAKAPAELTNPEKTMTGTIPAEPGRAERSFRYAPLSSGLEIVRKILSRHEIALIQSTDLDREAGVVRLTTTLAHASGEWMASEWPVCRLADLAAPRRMGAALTYARRYALFALVGIAGEDDLDAPDLVDQPTSTVLTGATPTSTVLTGTVQGDTSLIASRNRTNGRGSIIKQTPALGPDDSARERDRLLAELTSLTSLDQAAAWAKTILPVKNTLTREHAGDVEAAFERATVAFDEGLKSPDPTKQPTIEAAPTDGQDNANGALASNTLANSEPLPTNDEQLPYRPPFPVHRRRDKEHLKFVASRPCLLCGRRPSDAHHLRFAQPRALGRKVSDEFTVPLCRTHHRQVHHSGNELRWWGAVGRDIEPLDVARRLWEQSKGKLENKSKD